MYEITKWFMNYGLIIFDSLSEEWELFWENNSKTGPKHRTFTRIYNSSIYIEFTSKIKFFYQ